MRIDGGAANDISHRTPKYLKATIFIHPYIYVINEYQPIMKIELIFHPEWHKALLPIQSFRQLIESLVIAIVIGIVSTKILSPWPDGLFLVTLFAWVGILPILHFALPAKLNIQTLDTSGIMSEIERFLQAESYVKKSSLGNYIFYEVNLPKYFKWKESNIQILLQEERIIIDGPILILRIIRKRLTPLRQSN